MIDFRPWALLVFLTLLNVLNFADRFLMVALSNSIIEDLQLSNFQYTLLTGFVFTVFYTLCGMFMGTLADRYNRPRLIGAGIMLWSALTAVTGATKNFFQIGLARAFVGVGEATLTPAALAMLGDKFTHESRGLASGIYYLGIPVGISGAYLLAGALEPAIGWRGCFYLLGVVGVVLALLLFLVKDPPRGRLDNLQADPEPDRSFKEMMRELWRALRASKSLSLTMVGGIIVIFTQGATVLDPVWMVKERGYSEVETQRILGTIFLFSGVLGALAGGVLGDWLQRRRPGGRLLFLFLVYLILAPAILLFRIVAPDTPQFYALMFLGGMTIMLPFGPIMAAVQDLAAPRIRATVVAFLILCMALLGQGPGSAVAGYLADVLAAAGWTQPLTWALILSTLPGVLTIPVFWLAARYYEADRARLMASLNRSGGAESS